MKKAFSLVLCVVLLLSLVACGAESETAETTTAGTVSEVETVEEEVTEEVVEEEPAEPVEYDYSIVGDCYTFLTTCEPLLQSESEWQVYMWNFLNYEDDEEVSEHFAYFLSVGGSEDTLNEYADLLKSMVSKYEATEYDSEMLALLTACANEYYALNDLVVSPSGTFTEYQEAWEAQTEAYITAYDDMVAYLYDVGYFNDEED